VNSSVVSGRFIIEMEDRTVDLRPGQAFVVATPEPR
jgi:mannose-6-phosphate isomerase-like protein (cupin superfamily)